MKTVILTGTLYKNKVHIQRSVAYAKLFHKSGFLIGTTSRKHKKGLTK